MKPSPRTIFRAITDLYNLSPDEIRMGREHRNLRDLYVVCCDELVGASRSEIKEGIGTTSNFVDSARKRWRADPQPDLIQKVGLRCSQILKPKPRPNQGYMDQDFKAVWRRWCLDHEDNVFARTNDVCAILEVFWSWLQKEVKGA